jgi:hypothetical protein
MKHFKNFINESQQINESNQYINKEITPDNFNKFKFSDKQSALIQHLLKDYKENITFIYLVDGNKPGNNISQYFGSLIPKDERGILYIEKQSTSMGSSEEVVFYDSSKIKESKEKITYIYSYHTEENSKFKSAILTVDENNNSNIELKETNIKH